MPWKEVSLMDQRRELMVLASQPGANRRELARRYGISAKTLYKWLHRMRSLLIKFRTMQVNQIRGLLYEFGVSLRTGRVAGLAEIRARMAELEDAHPGQCR
jgi:transposase-like protein